MKKLIRIRKRPDGIISRLFNDDGSQLSITMEHSYSGEPKIPEGAYTCFRGMHRIPWHGNVSDSFISEISAQIVSRNGQNLIEFETFEITGVFGHANLLFHWGNYQSDSEGCVLTGEAFALIDGGQRAMVTNSRSTFVKFMAVMKGIDSFPLSVSVDDSCDSE